MNEFIEKTNYREKKVTSAEIIVTGTKDKPYFELKYKEVGKNDYTIGYSSYDLNNVFDWKEDCFEIVNELAEEYKPGMTNGGCVDCDECEHRSEDCLCDISENEEVCPLVSNNGWIPCSERLPEDEMKRYLVITSSGFTDILGFTKDAYKLSNYDFIEYKGKKKPLFYDCDCEYGYLELSCEYWQPLPKKPD